MKPKFTLGINAFLLLFTNIVALNGQIPSNGLVAYYSFNGNANDQSGNGNNGSVNGPALTTDRFGNANSAYLFDGSDDIIFNPNLTYGTVTDIDGNTYKTIQIGAQNWMAENLKTTKYNDGTSIPLETSNSAWAALSTPSYCWYNNDINNKATYGALYNWYTVNTGKLCPSGWHVPTDPEWSTLSTYLGGESVSGGKLKETGTTHWYSPNAGATNETGFTAVPGGYRWDDNGKFTALDNDGYWWSSSEVSTFNAWLWYIYYDFSYIYRNISSNNEGFSVRCVRDLTGSAPIAAFTASQTTITSGQSVQFTDQSTNTPTSWNWNFGDGGTSTSRNPSHTYTSAGTYSVSLTTTNSYGSDTETKANYITVTETGGGESDIIFNPNLTYGTVTDIDGNTYKTIQIGTQTWMAENLKTTKYNNGTSISLVTSNSAWAALSTPAYCWYKNDQATYGNTYGALYNWFTVNTGKLCPTGWHVPLDAEWTALSDYLGGLNIAGIKLKEAGTTHWNSPNADATNSSGFTALPSGCRFGDDGNFIAIGNGGYMWSSSEYLANAAWYLYFNNGNNDNVYRDFANKHDGFSVRCIKDENIEENYDISISFKPGTNTYLSDLHLKSNQFLGWVNFKPSKKLENVKIEASLDNEPLIISYGLHDSDQDNDIDNLGLNESLNRVEIYSKEFNDNIVDKNLIIKVVSVNGKSTDFKYNDKISMYFVKSKEENNRPFYIMQDIYHQFTNPSNMSFNEFIIELASYDYIGHATLLLFKARNSLGGRCYGMAASIGAYFLYPNLKPEPGYPWNWDASTSVLSNINAFSLSQLKYARKCNYENPNNIYESIKSEIKKANPVIIGLLNSYLDKGHAVLGFKITEYQNGDIRYIHIYENNTAEEKIITENKSSNSFSLYGSSNYDKFAYLPQEAFLLSDPVIAINAYNSYLANDINITKKKIFSTACPVLMYVANENGKRFGYLHNGTFVNEISEAEIYRIPSLDKVGDSITYIYTPSSGNYEVEMYCFDKGQVRFEYYEPSNSDQLKTAIIYDVPIESGNVLRFYDNNTSKLFIDNNGDGNSDNSLNTIEDISGPSNIEFQEANQFKIYPNPSADKILIEYHNPQDKVSEFEIYNSLGQLVMKSKFDNNNENWIDITSLANGLYYIKLESLTGLIKRNTIIIR